MNPDWKSAMRCIDNNWPICVFPSNHAPCVRRLHPSNKVEPLAALDPAAIPERSWIVVFRFLGVDRPPPAPILPANAALVCRVGREDFYSIQVWRTTTPQKDTGQTAPAVCSASSV